MLEFDYPYLLLFIPIVCILWYFFWIKNIYGHKNLPNPLLKKYIQTPNLLRLLCLIRCILVSVLIIIISKPSVAEQKTITVSEKQHTVIVFDISRSMISEDIFPSRMQVAKNTLQNFLNNKKSEIFSLIVFAGKPFLVTAESNDISWIKNFIKNLSPSYILQEKPGLSGTNIGDALILAQDTLVKKTGKKNILLITDGNANIGSDPLLAAAKSQKLDIPIYTIGIGSKTNQALYYTDELGEKKFFYDENGEKISAQIDEKSLQKISQISGGGKYYFSSDAKELIDAFEQMEKSTKPDSHQENRTIRTPLTLVFLVIFLVIFFIEHKIYTKILQKYRLQK